MDRRGFLGSLGATFASVLSVNRFLYTKKANTKTLAFPQAAEEGMISPRDVKINLKPVVTDIIHTGTWEGPCRWNRVEVSIEKARVEESFNRWSKEIKEGKSNLNDENVKVLEPAQVIFSEDFILRQEELNKLKSDSRETDVYFIRPSGASFAAFEIGKQFNRPIVMVGLGCRNVDIAAYSRSNGYEAFTPRNNDELKKLFSLLQARKVFTQTKVLFPTNRGFPAAASVCGVTDIQDLEKRLGIVVKQIPFKELADEMDNVMKSKLESEKAEQLADELIKNAKKSFIDRKYVVRSFEFYQTVKNLMNRHGCNAFTIECFEFCTSRLPEKWTIVPCLIHTLLRDRGYAASCEADLGALLAVRLLMSVSNKSSHMGNLDPEREGNTFRINHSVPGLKMNGYDQPDLPYQLGRFVESGWGTKAVVNFMDNTEKIVTTARVHPSAKKVLVLKGELVRAGGWDEDRTGCSVRASIKSPNVEKFLEIRSDYGNHTPWVYGDYSEEIKNLGEMLNMEVQVL